MEGAGELPGTAQEDKHQQRIWDRQEKVKGDSSIIFVEGDNSELLSRMPSVEFRRECCN
jgi:hypothetical protein